jgi:hypothetical protein
MNTKIKPCPRCGPQEDLDYAPRLVPIADLGMLRWDVMAFGISVECPWCGFRSMASTDGDELAIKLWNEEPDLTGIKDTRSAWVNDPEYPISDWQKEVENDDTRLGYLNWVDNRRETDQESAENFQKYLTERGRELDKDELEDDWWDEMTLGAGG